MMVGNIDTREDVRVKADQTHGTQTETDRTERGSAALGRIWSLLVGIFTWVVMLAAVGMMIFTVVSVTTFDRNDRDLFGYKAFIVRSDSMSATDFKAGDLILIKEVEPSTLQPGDIAAFRSEDPDSFGETFTHKIRSLTVNEEGDPAFITYGTATGVDDAYPAAYDQVLGQYQFALKGVGAFFGFLKTVPGYVCCILLPFLLLIIIQGVNSVRLFRQYKQEQMWELEEKRRREMEEMAAERKKLAAEREESRKMLEHLQKLQAQMSGGKSDDPAAENTDDGGKSVEPVSVESTEMDVNEPEKEVEKDDCNIIDPDNEEF